MNRVMSEFVKMLPNTLTLLRVLLACLLNFVIINHFGFWALIAIIFMVIFLTDFLDGKVARLCGNTSHFGAVFDILADLFFVVTSYIVLCIYHVLPLWFLFIMLFKFIEFTATSIFLKILHSGKSIFVFDFIGRFVAVLFYIIPVLVYLSFQFSPSLYFFTIHYFLYIITFMVLISSAYRLWDCIYVYLAKYKLSKTCQAS
jgi:CDP-diacylglycerol--glycerol-3-phosphate 3-phosphatidyltransferase